MYLEVANGVELKVIAIGELPLTFDGYKVNGEKKHACVTDVVLHRVLCVRGLANRLLSVRRMLERDGIRTYFNNDNSLGISDCLFTGEVMIPFEPHPTVYQVASVGGDCALSVSSRPPSWAEAHASLAHGGPHRLRSSNVTFRGVHLRDLHVEEHDPANCKGCLLGGHHRKSSRSVTAPSTRNEAPRTSEPGEPVATHFGQQIESDTCHALPPSFPHLFTSMTNFCDVFTSDFYAYFMVGAPNSVEVEGCLREFHRRVKHRLPDGRIGTWKTDNGLEFDGDAVMSAVKEICSRDRVFGVPNESNTHARPERAWGVLLRLVRMVLAHAQAPKCLWPWAVTQVIEIRRYLATSRGPSPYEREFPDRGPVDLSWAKPLFCDVTVAVPQRSSDDKLSETVVEGCYFGRDHRRMGEFVYVPSLSRLGTFRVITWRTSSFEMCKGITSDTPIEYHQDDLCVAPPTAALLPRQFKKRTGVEELRRRHPPPADTVLSADVGCGQKKEGASAQPAAVAERAACLPGDIFGGGEKAMAALAQSYENPYQQTLDSICRALAWGSTASVEIYAKGLPCLKGAESILRVTEIGSVPVPKTLHEARASKHWPLFREAMEEEIRGKMGTNNAWAVVARPGGKHVLKSRWVYTVKYNLDGSIKRVKARFVACGYSQIEGVDFFKVHAATLPAVSMRTFFAVTVGDDWELDQIDAVKAFTQSDVDAELHAEMPEGFEVKGYVLKLNKALEGIRQGAHLWSKKNQEALVQLGFKNSAAEPNVYVHDTLRIRIAVFVDDVLGSFHPDAKADYLEVKAKYGKLVNIDSTELVPVERFVGVQMGRNRQARTGTLRQTRYIEQLAEKYEGKLEMHATPVGTTAAEREAFEKLVPAADGEAIERGPYLELMGELIWPASMTRPDIAYHVSSLCSMMQSPTQAAYDAGLRVMGYLVATKNQALSYGGTIEMPDYVMVDLACFQSSKGLYAYSDSSWGKVAKPMAGYVVMLCNGPVDWSAKQLKVVADSTCEAETAIASRATKAIMFVRSLLAQLGTSAAIPTPLLVDNSALIQVVTKDGLTARTRYFERSTLLVKEAWMRGVVEPILVSTLDEVADIFTKALDGPTFLKLRALLCNLSVPASVGDRALKALVKLNSIIKMMQG